MTSRTAMLTELRNIMENAGVKPFGDAWATWHMTPRTFVRVSDALGVKPISNMETRVFGYPVLVEGDGEQDGLGLEVRFPEPVWPQYG